MRNFTLCYLLFFAFILSSGVRGQNVAINTTGTTPSASAILDLSNTASLALLSPQVSLANVATLAPVPAPGNAGLLVYNTNAATTGGSGVGYYYWDGAKWNYLITGASSAWLLTGNTGTNPGTNYLGTSDAEDLVLRTNAVEHIRMLAAGGIGIGTPTPKNTFDVKGNMSVGTYAGVNAARPNGVIISGYVGVDTVVPHASAALDVHSTTKGFLPPRMTVAQRNAIYQPATGLIILNSTTNCMDYYDGVGWIDMTCPCTVPPPSPGPISGSDTLCTGSVANTYSIAVVPTAASYAWTVPPTIGTISSGQGFNSITIDAATVTGSGIISVTAVNGCGNSPTVTFSIVVTTKPSTPGHITGVTNACSGSPALVYSIIPVALATSYTWNVPASLGTFTGQGSPIITVTPAAVPAIGYITVIANNLCGSSLPDTLADTISIGSHGIATFNLINDSIGWVVPPCVTQVTIIADGGVGGVGSVNATGGGNGTEVTGTFPVTPNNTLMVAVGAQGATGTNSGGGGGATYVWDGHSGALLIAAAGGGGGGYSVSDSGGAGGNNLGSNATTNGIGPDGAGGAGGLGGSAGTDPGGGNGAGGAGWIGNGQNEVSAFPCNGGLDRLNAFTGGTGYSVLGGNGGYGGGGGGGNNGGGGGGGFNGGGGGNGDGNVTGSGGGGGGSFISVIATATSATQINPTNGSVTIQW